MGHLCKKGGRKAVPEDDLIKAAIEGGLSEDKLDIDDQPVNRKLSDFTEPQYESMM